MTDPNDPHRTMRRWLGVVLAILCVGVFVIVVVLAMTGGLEPRR